MASARSIGGTNAYVRVTAPFQPKVHVSLEEVYIPVVDGTCSDMNNHQKIRKMRKMKRKEKKMKKKKRKRGRFYNLTLNLNLPASYCTCITMCPSSTPSFMPRSLVCFRILIDGL